MTVLILAGTGEARAVARAVSRAMADRPTGVVASLAGVTRSPEPLPLPTRIGGFGGEEGFRSYVAAHGVTAVLDATHPFAHKITDRTARVCAELGLPYAQLLRPGWQQAQGEHWTRIAHPREVAGQTPPDAVVFLATGRQTLAQYANLEGRRVLVRMIDPPTAPFPFKGGEFVIGRPPFTAQSERNLFEALGVTHLVVKDAGGAGGRAKLDAARALGIPVFMIDRPPMPQGTKVTSVEEAVAWVQAQKARG